MKQYPSIPSIQNYDVPCLAFYKYDGSNIRFEWSAKKGWHKFGTRTELLDTNNPTFGKAIDLFKEKYGSDLEKIFQKINCLKMLSKLLHLRNFLVLNHLQGNIM